MFSIHGVDACMIYLTTFTDSTDLANVKIAVNSALDGRYTEAAQVQH